MTAFLTALSSLIGSMALLLVAVFLLRIAKPVGDALTIFALRAAGRRLATLLKIGQHPGRFGSLDRNLLEEALESPEPDRAGKHSHHI